MTLCVDNLAQDQLFDCRAVRFENEPRSIQVRLVQLDSPQQRHEVLSVADRFASPPAERRLMYPLTRSVCLMFYVSAVPAPISLSSV